MGVPSCYPQYLYYTSVIHAHTTRVRRFNRSLVNIAYCSFVALSTQYFFYFSYNFLQLKDI